MLQELTNTPRDYAWGSSTLLADLESRPPASGPEAEVWFGDHPGDPADLGDGRTLDAVTGGTLPYLLKLLAADAPLSIQVHPTREQAREGFAREAGIAMDDPARNYRDDNHKPELIVALSDRFEALSGLRPLAETRRLVAGLGSAPGVVRLRELLAGDADPLRAALRWALADATESEVSEVIAAVEDADAADEGELDLVRRAADRFPGDRGVVVALLMNGVVLARGEGLFLRAGLLHAYVSGLGVEIMAASDNVLRGGLTPKHIDVAELLSVVDTTPGEVPVLRADAGAAEQAYPVPVADFALRRLTLDSAPRTIEVRGPAIVLATAGDVRVSVPGGDEHRVRVGAALYASEDETRLVLSGPGEAFLAEPGSPA
ncbi:mannose-6-phosphate isomerase, class I [Microbacterium resistens]